MSRTIWFDVTSILSIFGFWGLLVIRFSTQISRLRGMLECWVLVELSKWCTLRIPKMVITNNTQYFFCDFNQLHWLPISKTFKLILVRVEGLYLLIFFFSVAITLRIELTLRGRVLVQTNEKNRFSQFLDVVATFCCNSVCLGVAKTFECRFFQIDLNAQRFIFNLVNGIRRKPNPIN